MVFVIFRCPVYVLYRSSCPEAFLKKGVLRNFAKFTEKHLSQRLSFNKVAGLRPYRSFSIKFLEKCSVMKLLWKNNSCFKKFK